MTPADVLQLHTELFAFARSVITLALAAPFAIGLVFALAVWFGGDRI